MSNEPTNRFAQWAEESKKLRSQFSKGKKFADNELVDIRERVEVKRRDLAAS